MDTKLSSLQGIGTKSEKQLNRIGIYTRSDLEKVGPVAAFVRLQEQCKPGPSLNFLYAMVAALENTH